MAPWAEAHNLTEASRIVEVSSSVDAAIAGRAREYSLLILAETAYKRSFMERLFGVRREGFGTVPRPNKEP